MSGASMFMRFGYPPNALGYCGPDDVAEIATVASGDRDAIDHLEHLARAFLGAWPYLELIAAQSGLEPLDQRVVEAYWIGNSLLESVDTLAWGNSLDDRFRSRAGWDWEAVESALNAGGVPNHAFHVFCVYPWVGLLRSGASDQALEVLDKCRIRWGHVVENTGGHILVESQPLSWDGTALHLGAAHIERVDAPIDPAAAAFEPGHPVLMHWNYACHRPSRAQLRSLQRNQQRHLALVNGMGPRLARRVEE